MSRPATGLKHNTQVLLVEDDPLVMKTTIFVLEYLGYEVTTATGSREAIRLVQDLQDLFDIVITDLTMPGMNGIELAKNIKQIIKDIPIILITGSGIDIEDDIILDSGIKDIVTKPFTKDDLDLTIRNAINK